MSTHPRGGGGDSDMQKRCARTPASRHLTCYYRTMTAEKPHVQIPGWEGSIGPSPAQYGQPHAAEAEYRAREQAYVAALPGRAQEIADQFSGTLPDGLRFEWATDDGA